MNFIHLVQNGQERAVVNMLMNLQIRLKCREMCGLSKKISASQETLCTPKLVKGKEVRL
jgi:hypothetical protein